MRTAEALGFGVSPSEIVVCQRLNLNWEFVFYIYREENLRLPIQTLNSSYKDDM